jgi:hypothetical protein
MSYVVSDKYTLPSAGGNKAIACNLRGTHGSIGFCDNNAGGSHQFGILTFNYPASAGVGQNLWLYISPDNTATSFAATYLIRTSASYLYEALSCVQGANGKVHVLYFNGTAITYERLALTYTGTAITGATSEASFNVYTPTTNADAKASIIEVTANDSSKRIFAHITDSTGGTAVFFKACTWSTTATTATDVKDLTGATGTTTLSAKATINPHGYGGAACQVASTNAILFSIGDTVAEGPDHGASYYWLTPTGTIGWNTGTRTDESDTTPVDVCGLCSTSNTIYRCTYDATNLRFQSFNDTGTRTDTAFPNYGLSDVASFVQVGVNAAGTILYFVTASYNGYHLIGRCSGGTWTVATKTAFTDDYGQVGISGPWGVVSVVSDLVSGDYIPVVSSIIETNATQFNGWMEYILVFASAHSLANVQSQAAQRAPIASAWANWTLEQKSSDDSSGNGRNLTVVGTPTAASDGVKFSTTTNFSMSASGGSGAGTGTAATPKAARKLVPSAGAGIGTGTAATPKAGRKLVPTAGSGSGTGTAATTTAQRKLVPSTGTGAGAGTTATTTRAAKLVPSTGTGAGTGQTATPAAQRKLVPTGGSGTGTGTAATATAQRKLATSAGSATGTGTAATLKATRQLAATGGTGTGTGQTATLKTARKLVPTAGSATGTGTAATLLHKWVISALTGSATGTGSVATLTHAGTGAHVLSATGGTGAGAGQAVTLKHTWKLATASGAMTATGQAVTLKAARKLAAANGAAIGIGQTSTLSTAWPPIVLSATGGAALGTGFAATLRSKRVLSALTGGTTGTGIAAALTAARRLVAIASSATGTGTAATLSHPQTLLAAAGAAVALGFNVSFQWSGATTLLFVSFTAQDGTTYSISSSDMNCFAVGAGDSPTYTISTKDGL